MMQKIERPARPLLGIGLMLMGSLLLLSLVSYSPTDPSWSFSSNDSSIHNWGGLIGSWLSDLALQLVGVSAYLCALAMLYAGVRSLRSKAFFPSADRLIFSKKVRVIGILMGLISLSGLLSMIPLKLYSQISLGGWIGHFFSSAALFGLSTPGALLFFFAGLWASVIILSHNHLSFFKWPKVSLPALPSPKFKNFFGLRSKPAANPEVHLAKKLDDLFQKKDEPVKPIFEFKPKHPIHAAAAETESDSMIEASETPEDIPAEDDSEQAPAPKISAPESRGKRPLVLTTKRVSENYEFPSLQLLDLPQERGFEVSKDELIANSKTLEQKLLDFGVEGRVTNIRPGPIITLYEFEPAPGIKVKNIVNLTDDLKLAMKAQSIRILAPIPGRAAVGIEIPNPRRQTVYLREILQSALFQAAPSALTIAMGKTTEGDPYIADLAKMPHLLVAGATGSGKSVGVNAMVVSMLFKSTPDELKFIMIDPKMLELSVYEGIPHLLLPVVTDPKKAARALAWAVKEMERRYKLISSLGARNLKSFNEKVEKLSKEELQKEVEVAKRAEETTSAFIEAELDDDAEKLKFEKEALQQAGLDHYVKLPNIVVIIDELADLIMVAARDVEESIARLAQMARAAGIHLIIATQRPSVDVITGVIKANLPTRCAFQVASKVDSRTIIDGMGAENLIGEGDMLFLPPGTSRLERLHGPFISEDEIARVVRHLKGQAQADYSTTINLEETQETHADTEGDDDFDDVLYDQALQVVFETKAPSASMIQRRLRVGYNRAARMIERMEREGIVSAPQSGGKGRELLVTPSYE